MRLREAKTFEFFIEDGTIWVEYNGRKPIILADLLRSNERQEIVEVLYGLWRFIRVKHWPDVKNYPRDWKKAILLYITDKLGKRKDPLDVIYRTPTNITINRESVLKIDKGGIDYLVGISAASLAVLSIHGVGIQMTPVEISNPTFTAKGKKLRLKGRLARQEVVLDLDVIEVQADESIMVFAPGGTILSIIV